MIHRTRITVDQATREVLDQLDAQMTQKPVWADELRREHDNILQEIRKDLRADLAQVTRQSETVLTTAGRSTQAQIVEQTRRLDVLTDAVQAIGQQFAGLHDTTTARLSQLATGQEQAHAALTLTIRDLQETKRLVAPMTEQFCEIGTQISQQTAQLESLQNSAQQQRVFGQELLQPLKSSQAALEDLRANQLRLQDTTTTRFAQFAASQDQADAATNQVIRDLQETKQLVIPMAEQFSTIGTQTARQAAQLESLQHNAQQQQAFGQELLQTLKSSQVALENIRAEQMSLREALQCLSREVDALSRPWWQKVFTRHSK